MRMTLLGTGTSHGIPVIGCDCKVCKSTDTKNFRYRCSAFLEPYNFVIDTGPEFRLQALRAGITKVSAAFITHSHADHLNGLDDLRIFSHTNAVDPLNPQKQNNEGSGLPIYANERTIRDIKKRFDYVFTPPKEGGGKPKLNLINADDFNQKNPVTYGALNVIPIPIMHGSLTVTGWLFCENICGSKKSIAYLTDCSFISKESFEIIKQNCGTLCHVVIDGLRKEKHSTHFSFEEAMQAADTLNATHTWITHITHNMSHDEITDFLKSKIHNYKNLEAATEQGATILPAYDGLVLNT